MRTTIYQNGSETNRFDTVDDAYRFLKNNQSLSSDVQIEVRGVGVYDLDEFIYAYNEHQI